MNIDVLKSVFFVGDADRIDAFADTLKPRCIKSTDRTVAIDGVVNHLVYDTESGTYIAPNMSRYEEDLFSHELEPSASFVELPLAEMHFHNHGPRTRIVRTVRISHAALNTEMYLVQYRDSGKYLYRNPIWADAESPVWNAQDGYWDLLSSVAAFHYVYNVLDDDTLQYCMYKRADVVILNEANSFAVKVRDDSHLGYKYVRQMDVNSHPELFKTCSVCGQLWMAYLLHDGKCPQCNRVRVYGYHRWEDDHSRDFKHAEGEVVNNTTLFFGTEVETESRHPLNAQLTAPYQDIWHLERDGSLSGSGAFEMISQPMTWRFVSANYDRIKAMFEALDDAGQKAQDTCECGLHVHVSKDAFLSEKAVTRAVAIVNGMKHEMCEFARRGNRGEDTRYYSYSTLPQKFTYDYVDQNVEADGHHCAVNRHQYDDSRSTIEFRIFRSTLNPVTYMATLQFVNNIVNVANSNKLVVRFADLLHGEWIEQYVAAQKKVNRWDVDPDAAVNFSVAEMGSVWDRFISNGVSNESIEALVESLRAFLPENQGANPVSSSDSEEGGAE